MASTGRFDEQSGIRVIGPEIDYADGAEDRLLETLRATGDLRTGSDELAGHITDWPTRYHLGRARANLLRPLRLGPSMRVLDLGAGTGALTRYVAETGADVVAIEGSLARARAVATRCDGLPNVEVVCGSVDDLDDRECFDVVLCVGVLEYSGTRAAELLDVVRRLTRPGGALVLAIENQLGLKYLLGYGEDHLGEPWMGVEGYPTPSPVRTFSRRRLADLLAAGGFPAQRWVFAFPDYKLPSVLLDEMAYAQPGAETFVDQLVRWPCNADASAALRTCDDRRAHRVFLEAGIGPDVANSFLVVAGAEPSAHERLLDAGSVAWFFGGDRPQVWRVSKTFDVDPSRPVSVSALDPSKSVRQRGWLRQVLDEAPPRIVGPTVEQLVIDTCAREDVAGLAVELSRWRSHLRDLEIDVASDSGEPHPFRRPETTRLLPADHLDVTLANFLVDTDGALRYVDAEWRAPSGVDAEMASTRALWWLAADLVTHGVSHPWPPGSTVDELTEVLGGLCDTFPGTDGLAIWRHSEAKLQAKVSGRTEAECHEWLVTVGETHQAAPFSIRHLPFRGLRHALTALSGLYTQVDNSLQVHRLRLADVEQQLLKASDEAATLTGQLSAENQARLAAEQEAAAQADRASAAEQRWDAVERRRLVRTYRRLQRLAGLAPGRHRR